MKRWLMISAAAVALSSGAAQAGYTLHVLHINDFHSRVEPINKYDSTCDAETEAKNECFGGVARVASKINELRNQLKADGQNVVVLDAGDQYQGSLFYTTYKGKDTVEFMNVIGFDAMAVGNHEFDDGPGGLQILAEGVKFPVVSGNLDLSQSPELKDKVGDVLTLEVGGEKVGIVSALAMDTPETAAPGDKVIFMDDMESLKADVQELTDAGVTKINISTALKRAYMQSALDYLKQCEASNKWEPTKLFEPMIEASQALMVEFAGIFHSAGRDGAGRAGDQ